MFHKIPIRLRLSLVTALLLSICCIGLTTILNYSAYKTVDKLQAPLLTPSYPEGTLDSPSPGEIANSMPALATTDASIAKWWFSIESILYMLLVVISGSTLTYYIVGKTLQPLVTLNNQIKNIAIHNLSQTLTIPPTKDEIAELSVSFNDMTDKLHEAFLMQKRFSTSVAHELRTPLAVLQAKIDVFKKQPEPPQEEYNHLIDVINDQNFRLRKLVGTLLDMTNMNEMDDVTTIRLLEMIEDIVNDLSILAHNKNIEISIDADDSTIIGNIDIFYRVFYNLIENSIKYNVDGGRVEIHIHKNDSEQKEVLIMDTGIGIPKEQIKHIFEPFYRVDKSRSRSMGGVGLGLSFVENAVQKYGGSIEVLSNSPNGTCFRLLLK